MPPNPLKKKSLAKGESEPTKAQQGYLLNYAKNNCFLIIVGLALPFVEMGF
jgi:hypothetical protein